MIAHTKCQEALWVAKRVSEQTRGGGSCSVQKSRCSKRSGNNYSNSVATARCVGGCVGHVSQVNGCIWAMC
eukprot:170318-Chlamydomonas_euryale.AAC.1